MSEAAATARRWLTRQLEELGGLFNAGVRSPVFKQWRQNTLTCIQRIWPGDAAKSERFQRIPFSPPMGRPDEREVREYFAKGCGEALSLLKQYIEEIEVVGVPEQSGAATAAQFGHGTDEGAFPTMDLSGTGAAGSSAPRPVKSAMKIVKPRLKDLLGFTKDLLGFAEVPELEPPAPPPQPEAAPATAAGVRPLAPRPVPEPARAAPRPPVHEPDAPVMPRAELHELFAALEPGMRELPAPGPPFSVAPPISGVPPAAPQSKVVVTGGAPAAPPSPILRAVESAARAPAAPGIARHGEPGIEIEPEEVALERMAEELLRSSHLTLVPRPAGGVLEGMSREGRSSVALAIAALASEVEAFGVPVGHHARARAALLDLSRRLDDPALPWETLQEAMGLVMEYPALGRRVVPLLLPYLDRAA